MEGFDEIRRVVHQEFCQITNWQDSRWVYRKWMYDWIWQTLLIFKIDGANYNYLLLLIFWFGSYDKKLNPYLYLLTLFEYFFIRLFFLLIEFSCRIDSYNLAIISEIKKSWWDDDFFHEFSHFFLHPLIHFMASFWYHQQLSIFFTKFSFINYFHIVPRPQKIHLTIQNSGFPFILSIKLGKWEQIAWYS